MIMSDIVEKTLSSLPRLFSENLLGGFATSGPGVSTGSGPIIVGGQYGAFGSRGFHTLVRNVDYARSVAKEQHIIQKELTLIQQRLAQPDISVQQIRDYLTRLIFCHMMGYDVSCGYIHAVKLAQQGTGWMKWIGYLSCGILLHEDHELVVLLINTIIKDLRSTNILDNCIALSAVSRLVNADMIPLVLPVVEEKLTHSRPTVRKKAVAALFNIWRKNPSLVPEVSQKFSEALCDKDPSVVNVSLSLYHALIKENPLQYKNLGTPFINILNQILKRKLPPEYDYHSIPNPWMQISLLRLLTLLGAGDKNFSLSIYPVLREVLQRANMKENIAFAIIYECILTISRIAPDPDLLEEASKCVGKFLRSSNQNLKYLGMKALTSLVVVAPHYAVDYQMIVMECLENPDAAIQRKTLELMYQMANRINIDVISRNLLKYISKTSHDPFWQADIVAKLFSLVEKLSSSERWYVETINQLLEVTNGNVPDEIVYRLLNVIDDASKNDKEFALFVCTSYTGYLKKEVLPNTLIQVAVWVLGENPAEVIQSAPSTEILNLFLKHAFSEGTSDDSQSWIWMAITKLLHSMALSPEIVYSFLISLPPVSMSSETQQRFQEVLNLVKLCQPGMKDSPSEFDMYKMHQRMRKDSELDFTLSFVDDFVSESLENGDQPYKCLQQRKAPSENYQLFGGLEYGSYHTPTASLWDSETISSQDKETYIGTKESTDADATDWMSNPSSVQRLVLKGVKQVWSKDGLIQETLDKTNSGPKDSNNEASMVQSGSSSTKESTCVDSAEKREQDELASALFAGLPTKVNPNAGSDDFFNESTQDEMSDTFVCNPKFGNMQFSSPFGQLSKVRTEKKEKTFDWRTIGTGQCSSSLTQPDRDLNETTSTEPTTAVETLTSPSFHPLSPVSPDSKISSLYSDFYTTSYTGTLSLETSDGPLDVMDDESYETISAKAAEPTFQLGTDYIYLDNPSPINAEQSTTWQPTEPSVIAEEQNPEDIPLSTFAPLATLDNLIVRFCKMHTTSGLCVILMLDGMTDNSLLPTGCSISVECSDCLMPSVEMEETSILWSKTGISEFNGHIQKTSDGFPIYSKLYLQPTAIQRDLLSIRGCIQLEAESCESKRDEKFNLSLFWIDFARPHVLRLEEFTELWLKFSHSEKVTINQFESPSLSSFIGKLCRTIPAHCIYYKDGEALLSGQCIDSVIYLLHMKQAAKSVTVLLKSDNKDLLNIFTQDYLT